ncbi:MAG: hypothetical protein D6730_25335 [Bacteroidetes bacterium]|nr:MAG: hypothetical protein D6730_25335 [Bacteroidota bacterium]
MYQRYQIVVLLMALPAMYLLQACGQQAEPYPRPLGFHRIDLPKETQYQQFESSSCPFTFEYPREGKVTRDLPDSCWVDIQFPPYGCKWHITYRHVPTSGTSRSGHFEEQRRLIYNHIKKASEIKENAFRVRAGYGTMYEVYGNVGTPLYLFLSDSSDTHVLMSTFYFRTAMKNDSLAPVIEYMKGQMMHAMETLKWQQP